jgi:ABC-2 type transport system permease protein
MAIQGIVSSTYTRIRAKDSTALFFGEKLSGLRPDIGEVITAEISNGVDEKLKQEPPVSVEMSRYENGTKSVRYDGKAQSSLGFAVMFVMFTIMIGAGEILEEKKTNTWGRLNMTPSKKAEIILGKVLGTFLRGWFQIAFLILFGSFVMGVSWGNSIFSTILVISAFLLCVTGIGMLLAAFVKTNAQLGAVSTIIIMSTTMVSGCWWPLELEPVFMQRLAVIFPQYWAMKGLTNTVVGNLGIQSVIMPVLVLSGMAAAFFALTLAGGAFRVEFKKTAQAAASADIF